VIPQDIPVIINSFNRLACLQRLVAWLQQAGTRRIIVIDNASDYPPLLAWYRSPEAANLQILRLDQNRGALALWEHNLLAKLGIQSEYIYSDSDVVPAEFCPLDAIGHLHSVLRQYAEVKKAGLGLRLDNLPDTYQHRNAALLWERQFWRRPAAPGLMWAPLDTTFALYRAGGGHALEQQNLRTTHPYLADHLGWHSNSANPTPEDQHYDRTARRDITSWTGDTLRPDFAAGLPGQRTPNLLQLQNGPDIWPGWEQGDTIDLAALPEASFDGFHIAKTLPPLPIMQALHRAAKPNARLLARLPAQAEPKAALQYGAPAHEGSPDPYAGDWAVSAIRHFPSGDWLIHLFAVKPVRARVRSLEFWPPPIPSASGLSPEPPYDVV
jgi:hypothetical protein